MIHAAESSREPDQAGSLGAARRRRNLLGAMLALVLAGWMVPAPAAAGSAKALGACELHLWGAAPDFSANRRLAGPAAPRGTADADRANPLANINLLDPAQRLRALDDAALARLLPQASPVTVVRHDALVEIGKAKRAKAPIAPSPGQCRAELFLMELYDIDGPTDSRGLLVDMLRAPNGWHATYILRVFDAQGRMASQHKASMVAPLAIARPDWAADPQRALAALDQAVRASLEIFRAGLEKKHA